MHGLGIKKPVQGLLKGMVIKYTGSAGLMILSIGEKVA
jgi:hypothetical protein